VDFFDFLLLLVLLLVFFFLNFDVVFLVLAFTFLIVIFFVGDFLLFGLLDLEFNGEGDEFGVLLDEVLDAALLEEFEIVVLHVEDDLGTTGNLFWVLIISDDGEGTTCSGLPSVLVVIIVGLRDNGDSLSNQVSRVETDTELTNHRDISTVGKSFHERFCARLSNSSEMSDELLLCHADTSVPESEGVVGLIRDDPNLKFGLEL